MSVYVASPLGFSEAGRSFYYSSLLPYIRGLDLHILDPWKLTPAWKIRNVQALPYGTKRRNAWRLLNLEIAANNRRAIDRATALLAILDGSDVDSGTAAEVGYAFARGKLIIGYRGDFRLSADNEGSTVNLQVEYFIRESGGVIVSHRRQLKTPLRALHRVQRRVRTLRGSARGE